MSVQTFNNHLVESNNGLIIFNDYSDKIINEVFINNGVFKELRDNSDKKGYIIHSSLLEKYCNLKITSSTSLKTIGLENKKDYKKNKGYYLTFNAFEKCVKEHSKEYQEYIKKIGEYYGDYCQLFYNKSETESESSSDNSSDCDSEEELNHIFNDMDKVKENLQSFKRITGNESNLPEYVKTLNKELNNSGNLMPFFEYFKKLCKEHFKTEFEFTDELLAILRQEGCSIHHSMLIKYGVSTEKTNNIIRSLERIGKIEGKDFKIFDKDGKLLRLEQFSKGGRGKILTYMITPETFSELLQKTTKKEIGDKYRSFFTILAKIADYYDEFGIEYQKKYQNIIQIKIKRREERQKRHEKRLLKNKDITIKQKECKIDELKETVNRIEEMNKRMEKSNLEMKKTVEDTNSQLLEISRDLKTVISKVSEFKVPRNKQKSLSEVIGICKEPTMIDGYETYHVVRCQNKYYETRIKEKYDKYNAVDLFRIDTNNSALCWHSMRQYFEKNNRFITDTYSFKYRGRIEEDRLQELLSNSVKIIKSQVSDR